MYLADSYCSEFTTSNHNYSHTYIEFDNPRTVSGIREGQLLAYGSGPIILQSLDNNGNQHSTNNVWYVPFITESSISLNATIAAD